MDGQAWQYIFIAGALIMWLPTGGRSLWRRWQAFKVWEADQSHTPPSGAEPAIVEPSPLIVRGIGGCAEHPPIGFAAVMREIEGVYPRDPLRLPLGWFIDHADHRSLLTASLHGDTDHAVSHILLTGQSRCGKDHAARLWFLVLTARNPPERFQAVIIDGKGLDWAWAKRKAHLAMVACQPEDIGAAMEYVTAERLRRATLLTQEQETSGEIITRWEDSHLGLPLIWVFISELAVLEAQLGSSVLERWMSAELSAAAAFGIRFVVGTQDAANFKTRWRRQIGLYVAGYQPNISADEPNTGAQGSEIERRGAVPPSKLPVPPARRGYFCLVHGGAAMNVKTSPFAEHELRTLIGQLPDRASPERVQRVQNGTVDAERLNAGSWLQNGLERIPERSEPDNLHAETAFSERLNANADELQKLGVALGLYHADGRKQHAIEHAFGVTKGAGAGWRRASELFDTAYRAPT